MTLRLVIPFALFFLATSAVAQPDVNALIEEMVSNGYPPEQEKLAARITDALIERAHEVALPALIEDLQPDNQQHLRQVSWQQSDRAIHVATLWHQNSFQHVRYEQQECSGQNCYAINVYPIIQWRKANGSWGARSLYKMDGEWPQVRQEGAQAEVRAIHKLQPADEELYLLLGDQAGNREPAYITALVIAFEGDELKLDYPAFKQRYPLLEASIYDARKPNSYRQHMSFDPDTQILSFVDLDSQFIPGLSRKKPGRDKALVAQDSSRLQHSILNKNAERSLALKFVDGHFVRVE